MSELSTVETAPETIQEVVSTNTKKKAAATKAAKPAKTAKPVKAMKADKKPAVPSNSLIAYDPKTSYMQIGNSVKELIASLPSMKTEQLTNLFRNTVDVERAMFVVRGATAHELIKRAIEDGKKFDKTKGNGVDTMINEIAKEVGIDGKTLYADYKVFDEFGGWLKEQLTEAPDTIMPREFYVLAMKTTTMAQEPPSEILNYFQEQRESTGGYFTDHARRDAKLFNEGKTIEQVKQLDAEQRIEKVAEKNSGAKKAQVPAERYASLQIVASDQNINYCRKILEKYASFNEWFERKCKDEFGAADEGK